MLLLKHTLEGWADLLHAKHLAKPLLEHLIVSGRKRGPLSFLWLVAPDRSG